MTVVLELFIPLFVGPTAFLLGTLMLILLILAFIRLVFGLAWRLVLLMAVVLGLLWLIQGLRIGPPGLG